MSRINQARSLKYCDQTEVGNILIRTCTIIWPKEAYVMKRRWLKRRNRTAWLSDTIRHYLSQSERLNSLPEYPIICGLNLPAQPRIYAIACQHEPIKIEAIYRLMKYGMVISHRSIIYE